MKSIDDELKNAKELIPDISPNLKEDIILEYENRIKEKPKFLSRKKMTLALSFLSTIAIVLIFVPLIANSFKNNSKVEVVDYSCSVGSSSSFCMKEGGSALEDSYLEDSTKSEYSTSDGVLDKDEKEITIVSSTLTSSCVDDNSEYDFFKTLLTKGQNDEGVFYQYKDDYKFNVENRIVVKMNKGLSANVKLLSKNDDVLYETKVDNFGNAYLFGDGSGDYKVIVEGSTYKYTYNNINSDLDLVDKVSELKDEKVNKIELMFVIDATGSMGDELEYLKVEIDDVISKIKKQNDNVEILLAIMVYRDEGDEYVTRYQDFSDDINLEQEFLKNQEASGGGDFEEAVDVALDEALNKGWSSDDSTKIIVHVLDAPAHDEMVEKWNNVVKGLSKKGIKIITVASSGIDKKTEYFLRCEAMMTGGYYGYLTDDSGVGYSHTEATTKEKPVVEHLNKMLIRLISGIYSGELEDPIYYKQEQ